MNRSTFLKKLFSIKALAFLSSSIVGQASNLVVGILLARVLTIQEYSIYVIILMLNNLCLALSTGGINIAFTSLMGKYWPNRSKVSGIFIETLAMRKRFSLYVLPLLVCVGATLLMRNGETFFMTLILVLLVVINLYLDLNTRLFERILTFRKLANYVQLVTAITSLFRLGSVLLLIYIGALNIYLAYLTTLSFLAVKMIYVQRKNEGFLTHNTICEDNDKQHLVNINKKQFPSTIFDCFKSQIAVMILAYSGNTVDTAAYGALTRVSQVYLPMMIILQSFAIPNFAKKKDKILRTLLAWSTLAAIPGLLLTIVCFYYPQTLLSLLGDKYLNFEFELLLVSMSVTFAGVTNIFNTLVANRGWNKYVMLQIPIVLTWFLVALYLVDINVLIGVIIFNSIIPLGLFIASITSLISGLNEQKINATRF
jgi:O-antigen/teichoic acid export membrane protein